MKRIDPYRPMRIYGSVTRHPAFLRSAKPVEAASFSIDAAAFLEWMDGAEWALGLLKNLQCLSEAKAREKLLTTWMSADRFWAILDTCRTTMTTIQIATHTAPWRQRGLVDEICFEFYASDDGAHETQRKV